ncbi:hypothetical protein BB560_000278 [Smittium megazygosporum]|uniref:HMG box domain-containing protein n=1 Tax=Smittium megazygosporum TaxID=133381 RepID=A0A2T9ZKU3_9FUNG|nr:hypothetical protein BB560_000278 [Smittium megazygosporum]
MKNLFPCTLLRSCKIPSSTIISTKIRTLPIFYNACSSQLPLYPSRLDLPFVKNFRTISCAQNLSSTVEYSSTSNDSFLNLDPKQNQTSFSNSSNLESVSETKTEDGNDKVIHIFMKNTPRHTGRKCQTEDPSPLSRKQNSSKPIISPPPITITSTNIFVREEYRQKKPRIYNGKMLIGYNKVLMEKWNTFSDEEKRPYIEKAKIERLKLQENLKEWWENVDLNLVKLENKRRENINAIRKAKGKYKMPLLKNPFLEKNNTPNAFCIFLKNEKSNYSHLRPTEQFKAVARDWKELSDEEKGYYNDLYNEEIKKANPEL